MTSCRVCNKNNTTYATREAWAAYPSEALEFIDDFSEFMLLEL
jgi:hypothetical protein